ncbi:MAG TPA: hypothetical protein VNM48_07555 [Chloroflexota bacterium]|nr:hypothetical protein [Chloroflexota bacterium]
MPITEEAFNVQIGRLLGHYRPGEPGDRFASWLEEIDTAFVAAETTSDAAFTDAVTRCIRQRQTRGLPTVAELAPFVTDACQAEQRERAQALPAPARHASAPDPVARAWNVAVGRAMARKHIALIDAYRKANGLDARAPVPESVWQGLDEPTEDEIRAVLAESGNTDIQPAAAVTAVRGVQAPISGMWPGVTA